MPSRTLVLLVLSIQCLIGLDQIPSQPDWPRHLLVCLLCHAATPAKCPVPSSFFYEHIKVWCV